MSFMVANGTDLREIRRTQIATAGTQAQLFCALSAQNSLGHSQMLPRYFRPWLNIFPNRLNSQSAYWANRAPGAATISRLP